MATCVRLGIARREGRNFSHVTRQVCRCPRIATLGLVDKDCSFNMAIRKSGLGSVSLFISRRLTPVRTIVSATARFILGECGTSKGVLATPPSSSERIVSL